MCCNILPCVGMYCQLLPTIAMYCHVLQFITMYYHVLLCFTIYSNVYRKKKPHLLTYGTLLKVPTLTVCRHDGF